MNNEQQNIKIEDEEGILEQYAKLKEEKEEIEEVLTMLGVKVQALLSKHGIDKAFLPAIGTFSLINVPRWTYSEGIQNDEKLIKEMKEKERAEGIAESQNTTSLRFTKEK